MIIRPCVVIKFIYIHTLFTKRQQEKITKNEMSHLFNQKDEWSSQFTVLRAQFLLVGNVKKALKNGFLCTDIDDCL